MLDVSGPFAKGSEARSTAFHEYTHHIIANYTNIVYPQWYNEGYAEYLSTFHVNKKGVVSIGLPEEGRAKSLVFAETEGSWFDMDILVNSIRKYPNFKKKTNKQIKPQALFYAQSWLAVHYLISNKDYADKINVYLEALNQENVPEDVFEKSFGISPDDFGKVLKKYYKKNKYKTLSITLPKRSGDDIQTRPLTDAEADFRRAEVTRRFARSDDLYALSEKYYGRALEAGYPRAEVQASRALIALEKDDNAGALIAINEALNLDGDNGRILQIAGYTYLSQYDKKSDGADISTIQKARTYLKQALRANPRNMEAHYDYVTTYDRVGDKASKQAVYSAEECTHYYKGENFMGTNMKLADILLKNGKPEAARPVLHKASIWSSSAKTRARAKKALQALP